jgi:hypothetical protein
MISLAAVASVLGIAVDIDRLFVQNDPAYLVLLRALVRKADEVGDRLDKARAVKIANAMVKSQGG